jgi:hypothetical protein
MRRLILQTGISIDGYVAALDRSHPRSDGGEDETVKRWILDSVWAAGARLMGRVTYEGFADRLAVAGWTTLGLGRPGCTCSGRLVGWRTLECGAARSPRTGTSVLLSAAVV